MKFHFSIRKLAVLVLVAAIGVAVLPAAAQLPDDQAENLEYMLETLASAEEYSSFAVSAIDSRTIEVEVLMGEQALFSQSTATASEETATFVDDGQLGNVLSTTVVTGSNTQNDVTTEYVINAEVRVVDGVVYVNAAYETPDPSLPALPEGWTVLEAGAVEMYPGIADLDMNNILDALEAGERIALTSDLDQLSEGLRAATSEVVVEEGATTEDGRTGTAYLATLSADGLGVLMGSMMSGSDATNPMLTAMVENLGPESGGIFGILVDDAGYIAEMVLSINIVVTDLDVSAIDPNVPTGTTANMNMSAGTILTLSEVDADLPLAEAPAE